MWLFSYELKLEALEENTRKKKKKSYWVARSSSECLWGSLFHEWKVKNYTKKKAATTEKISWISIKRINNQHSPFWFKFRRKKKKKLPKKNSFLSPILAVFFLCVSTVGINNDDDFLRVLRLSLNFVFWTKGKKFLTLHCNSFMANVESFFFR